MEAKINKQTPYHRQVYFFSKKFIKDFQRSSKFFLHFNVFFVSLLAIEACVCLYSLNFYADSFFIPLFIAFITLSFFSYLILFFYFHTKKPDQFHNYKDQFLRSCRSCLQTKPGQIEHHLSICSAISYLIEDLKLSPFSKVFKKIAKNLQDEDLFTLKEVLLVAAKNELVKQITNTPVDIEIHASLAMTYVKLSSLYKEQKKTDFLWKQKQNQKNKVLDKKFSISIKRAIEEFQILNDLAPQDPWVHAQLAKSYDELDMTQEQMGQYEKILELRPDDHQVLFQCACCYFKLGYNAKGLKAYEKLKNSHFLRAKDLLAYYGKENLTVAEL
jgi:tetratricopeptide (TPR) repeat protein